MRAILSEIDEILSRDFTGQIVLHVNEGSVVKYEVRETRRPTEGSMELSEIRPRLTGKR